MIALIKRLCHHEYVWVRNIYGDEINAVGGRRSLWRCKKCGKLLLSNALVDEEQHCSHRGKKAVE
jgi:hypothetical protein